MAKRATSTSFKPGQSGNPKGRPRGIKETVPRGTLRQVWMQASRLEEKNLLRFARAMLTDRKYGLHAQEFAARLMKEIGSDRELASSMKPTRIIFITNVDPLALGRQPEIVDHVPEDGEASRPGQTARRPPAVAASPASGVAGRNR